MQVELGDVLLRCFDTPSGVPYSDVTLHTGVPHGPKWETHSTVSEVTSIQLEFRELSRLTGDSRYRAAADATLEKVQAQLPAAGLVPQFISPDTGQLRSGRLTLGARADSYYEYLLKQWLQSCKTEEKLVQSLECISVTLEGRNFLVVSTECTEIFTDFISQICEKLVFEIFMPHSQTSYRQILCECTLTRKYAKLIHHENFNVYGTITICVHPLIARMPLLQCG